MIAIYIFRYCNTLSDIIGHKFDGNMLFKCTKPVFALLAFSYYT